MDRLLGRFERSGLGGAGHGRSISPYRIPTPEDYEPEREYGDEMYSPYQMDQRLAVFEHMFGEDVEEDVAYETRRTRDETGPYVSRPSSPLATDRTESESATADPTAVMHPKKKVANSGKNRKKVVICGKKKGTKPRKKQNKGTMNRQCANSENAIPPKLKFEMAPQNCFPPPRHYDLFGNGESMATKMELLDSKVLKLRAPRRVNPRKAIPEEEKNDRYYEHRRKNTEAARRCREKKRAMDARRVEIIKAQINELVYLKEKIAEMEQKNQLGKQLLCSAAPKLKRLRKKATPLSRPKKKGVARK